MSQRETPSTSPLNSITCPLLINKAKVFVCLLLLLPSLSVGKPKRRTRLSFALLIELRAQMSMSSPLDSPLRVDRLKGLTGWLAKME